MRIGLVLPDIPQYSETFFNSKIKSLTESGFEVIIFSGKRTNKNFYFKHSGAYPVFKNKPVKQFAYIFFILILTFLKAPSRTLKLFSAERRDGNSFFESLKKVYLSAHIISYKLDWLHFGFATMALKRENAAFAAGARMGVSFRGYDINIYPLKNPGCYRKLWEKVDKVHSISEYLYKKALTLGLSEKTDYEIITPSVNAALFNVKPDAGRIKSPLKILTVGRLNWIKNYETAISGMKILKEKGIEFRYEIIGAGTELERLKFAVYQCGLEEYIDFTGQTEHEKIMKKMSEADIYLQTSYQEGFCVSVLEAQASGLLCVVSDADGLKENIVDGETGWIVSKRKPEEFANKIIELMNMSEEKRKETALKARQRVERFFNPEDQKVKFINFYKN